MTRDKQDHINDMEELAEAYENITCVMMGVDDMDELFDDSMVSGTTTVETGEMELGHYAQAMRYIEESIHEEDPPVAASLARVFIKMMDGVPEETEERLEKAREMQERAGIVGSSFGSGRGFR